MNRVTSILYYDFFTEYNFYMPLTNIIINFIQKLRLSKYLLFSESSSNFKICSRSLTISRGLFFSTQSREISKELSEIVVKIKGRKFLLIDK
jgi:hypothetical protein